ncbi:MAG: hypothetical protein ACI9BW_001444 [Gammaproteobacteria bacterium]|jgi:hypothetical protein
MEKEKFIRLDPSVRTRCENARNKGIAFGDERECRTADRWDKEARDLRRENFPVEALSFAHSDTVARGFRAQARHDIYGTAGMPPICSCVHVRTRIDSATLKRLY